MVLKSFSLVWKRY